MTPRRVDAADADPTAATKHLALTLEIPNYYVKDLLPGGELDEYRADFDDESEFLLNSIGGPSVARVRMEISGEKDGEVIEVWASVRAAALVDASRGYDSVAPCLTTEQLEENGEALMRDENACEWCRCADYLEEEEDDE